MTEGTRGEGREKIGMMEGNGNTSERRGSLYLEKAAGRLSRRALPQPAAPTPFRRPLTWKQESAPLLPSPRL